MNRDLRKARTVLRQHQVEYFLESSLDARHPRQGIEFSGFDLLVKDNETQNLVVHRELYEDVVALVGGDAVEDLRQHGFGRGRIACRPRRAPGVLGFLNRVQAILVEQARPRGDDGVLGYGTSDREGHEGVAHRGSSASRWSQLTRHEQRRAEDSCDVLRQLAVMLTHKSRFIRWPQGLTLKNCHFGMVVC